jgi:response regulator RpfG family c-di-GMP phosphodiesterase
MSSKGSILVVDDESEIREGLELLLNMEGYSTSSAETGEAGLAMLLTIFYCSTSAFPTVTDSNCCAKSGNAIRIFPLS